MLYNRVLSFAESSNFGIAFWVSMQLLTNAEEIVS